MTVDLSRGRCSAQQLSQQLGRLQPLFGAPEFNTQVQLLTPGSCCCRPQETPVMPQVVKSPTPVWGTQMEFPTPSFSPSCHLGSELVDGSSSASLSNKMSKMGGGGVVFTGEMLVCKANTAFAYRLQPLWLPSRPGFRLREDAPFPYSLSPLPQNALP